MRYGRSARLLILYASLASGVGVRRRPDGRAAAQRRVDAAASIADRQRDADRVRLRQQHLDRRPRRRRRRGASRASRARRRTRSSRPTASRSRSAASTPATSTSTSSPPRAASRKRLTWHPGADIVQGWTPDGKSVVFASAARRTRRAARRASGPFRSKAASRQPMPLPRAYQGKISPDGTHIAYRMNNSWDEERRNYRGGQNRPIWIVDLKTFDLVSPPWTDSKDMDPVWVGDAVYFLSDRDGVSNVWAYDTKRRSSRRSRSSPTSTSRRSTPAPARVVFEQAGLHPRARSEDRASDRSCNITRHRRLPVDDAAVGGRHGAHDRTSRCRRPASASPSKRAARSSRSPPRRATSATSRNSSGSAERDPAWSPDGKSSVVLQRQVGRVQARTSSRRTA